MNIGSKKREEWEKDEYRLTLLTLWRVQGKTEKSIAKQMGISYSTLREWKKESPAIKEALQNGTEDLAIQIASSMVKKAKGYDVTEKEIILKGKSTKNGTAIEDGKIVQQKNTIKHIPPDVKAGEFLLKNFQPDIWKEKHDVSIDGNIETTNDVVIYLPEPLSEEECQWHDDDVNEQ